MSENKGKAKVKAKSKSTAKSTMKSAGKSKAAVMNSRNPKKPMAISGDTMSNYAMYKKGGRVKKYAAGGSFPDLTGDGKVTKADILKGRGVIKQKGGVTKKPTSPIGTGQKVDMIKQWLNKYNSKNK